MSKILSGGNEEKTCRPCELVLGFMLLIPLSTFAVLSVTAEDTQYWGFIAILIGLPFALVAIKIIFMNPKSKSRGILPPFVLYAFGCLCFLGPFAPHPNYAAVGLGIVVLRLARHRQVQVRAEHSLWNT